MDVVGRVYYKFLMFASMVNPHEKLIYARFAMVVSIKYFDAKNRRKNKYTLPWFITLKDESKRTLNGFTIGDRKKFLSPFLRSRASGASGGAGTPDSGVSVCAAKLRGSQRGNRQS